MIFDPFDDFNERGYLRNFAGEKDQAIIKRLEHRAFLANLDMALIRINSVQKLSYQNVLDTHRTLFESIYPWAGQDRAQTAPDKAVSKGKVLFAHPNDARKAVDYALDMGQDKRAMAAKPGEVMAYFAYGHPFLDGNGRTILTIHTELAQRAGIGIHWAETDKAEYLTALTRELETPGKGHLDIYLKPFVVQAASRERLAAQIILTPGIDGRTSQPMNLNEVLGRFSDPAVQARYQAQELHRQEAQRSRSRWPTIPDDFAVQRKTLADKWAVHNRNARNSTTTHDPAEPDRAVDKNNRPDNGDDRGGRGR